METHINCDARHVTSGVWVNHNPWMYRKQPGRTTIHAKRDLIAKMIGNVAFVNEPLDLMLPTHFWSPSLMVPLLLPLKIVATIVPTLNESNTCYFSKLPIQNFFDYTFAESSWKYLSPHVTIFGSIHIAQPGPLQKWSHRGWQLEYNIAIIVYWQTFDLFMSKVLGSNECQNLTSRVSRLQNSVHRTLFINNLEHLRLNFDQHMFGEFWNTQRRIIVTF